MPRLKKKSPAQLSQESKNRKRVARGMKKLNINSNVRQNLLRRLRLADDDKRQRKYNINDKSRAKRLADPIKRDAYIKKRRLSYKVQDPVNRAIVKEKNRINRGKRLSDPNKRAAYNERKRKLAARRLLNAGKRELYNGKKRKRLSYIMARLKHRQINKRVQKMRLRSESNRKIHLKRCNAARRKRMQNKEKLHKVTVQRSVQRQSTQKRSRAEWRTKLFQSFMLMKLEGPTYECKSCQRLWFKSSVRYYDDVGSFPAAAQEIIKNYCRMENDIVVGYLCRSCQLSLKKGKVPKLNIMSNVQLQFPMIPEQLLKLTELEERFLCPRIPFMTIRAAIGDQQYLAKGKLVNVPINVASSVDILPRVSSDMNVIPICFRRKKSYKSNVMFENVRPKVVQDAAKVLRDSPVYKHCGITVDLSRTLQLHNINLNQPKAVDVENDDTDTSSVGSHDDDDDETSSDDEPFNLPDEQTLLMTEAKVFAPGEGQAPVSLFDTYAEALSFVKIYGGQLVHLPKGITYQNWVKSELMRSDRRCATITKLFFTSMKLRTQKIAAAIYFCLRKSRKASGEAIRAADMLDPNYMEGLEKYDGGFKVFTTDRGSPAFWEAKKKELFAMIRQLGPPTFFLTVSPAESKWPELIVILKKIVDGVEITMTEASLMAYKEKARLIRSDPVTLARYFDHRMREFFQLLTKKDSIFDEHVVVDSYIRTEFQQRGSPHCHSLIWLKDAPKFNGTNSEEVLQFVDRFVSCSNDFQADLLQFQIHRHTFTCRKGKRTQRCRFDIPHFPFDESCILVPLDVGKQELARLREVRCEIQLYLGDVVKKNLCDTSLDDLLTHFKLSRLEYSNVVRSGLKRPTIYVKRRPIECMINFYNQDVLKLHCANMDIQYILDAYSCATYVSDYLNKSNRGMSKMLVDAAREIRAGSYTMRQQLQMIASHFLNASEFTAQEAVYYVLAMPLSKSTRRTEFINTSAADKRVRMVLRKELLEAMPDNCTDIYTKGVVEHYVQRPDELEDVCLATFTAMYTFSTRKTGKEPDKSAAEGRSDEENSEDEGLPSRTAKVFQLKDKCGYVRLRTKAKVIRFCNFNKVTQESDYVRENVMLYVPWRDETVMALESQLLFEEHRERIKTERAKYVFDDDFLSDLEQAEQDTRRSGGGSQDQSQSNRSKRTLSSYWQTRPDLAVYGAHSKQGDIAVDMPDVADAAGPDNVAIPVPKVMEESRYQDLVSTLNAKQRILLLHILHLFKTETLPFHHVVLGGAGVGKSRVIEAIQQTIMRWLNNKVNTDLESIKVLLCAPTGKAAFGIKGTTLHAAFILPLSQASGELPPLSNSASNTLASRLKDVQLIIIDEISMVGSRMIQQVDCRLKQVFRSNQAFAGLSVLAFGDFNQLSPVGDRYIFQSHSTDNYGDLIGNPLWSKFTCYELTEIMRQKDDKVFAEALTSLARGTLTDEQINTLETRIVTTADVPNTAVRLFRSNADVDRFNASVIDKDPNKVEVIADDKVASKVNKAMEEKLLKSAKISTTRDVLPYKVILSIDVKYMITVNLDVEDGLTNGAVGVLKEIEYDTRGQVVRLWLMYADELIGKKRRREVRHSNRPSWTGIERVKRNVRPSPNNHASVIRTQFPLVAAEALTIYKSQGGTFDQVAIHLVKGLRRNEIYVALSRCTKLSGLYLIGDFKAPAKPNPRDALEVEMLRLKSLPFVKSCLFPSDIQQGCIVYHNVQSLKNTFHWNEIKNFMTYERPALFIAAETSTTSQDDVEINGYGIVYRRDGDKRTAGQGFVIYERTDQVFSVVDTYENAITRTTMVLGRYNDTAVITGYRPPSAAYSSDAKAIDYLMKTAFMISNKVIFLGDFNISIDKNTALANALKTHGFTIQCTEATTNYATAIDLVYGTYDFLAGVCETLFSYHKQLVCVPNAPRQLAVTRRKSIPQQQLLQHLTLMEAITEGKCIFRRMQQANYNVHADSDMLKKLIKFLLLGVHSAQKPKPSTVDLPASLKPYFVPVTTTGDGNCFYYALSSLLAGQEHLMQTLRAIEAAHIMINRGFLNELDVPIQTTVDVKGVLTINTYAEVADILIYSLILRRPINVYTGEDSSSMRFAPIHADEELHLYLDVRASHYTALKLKKKNVKPRDPDTCVIRQAAIDRFISF